MTAARKKDLTPSGAGGHAGGLVEQEFTGLRAAALMTFGPAASVADQGDQRVVPILAYLRDRYITALAYHADDGYEYSLRSDEPGMLPSKALQSLVRHDLDPDGRTVAQWAETPASAFESQIFSREALASCLAASGRPSLYQFQGRENAEKRPAKWPWGQHHTELLQVLEAAATTFFGPNATSKKPTKALIAGWVLYRINSERLSEGIASLLLPDGKRLPRDAPAKWPWGSHATMSLYRLYQAAEKFWRNYEPGQTDTSKPNKEIVEWLQETHDVSEYMAGIIASVLRADDLPDGRRKNG